MTDDKCRRIEDGRQTTEGGRQRTELDNSLNNLGVLVPLWPLARRIYVESKIPEQLQDKC